MHTPPVGQFPLGHTVRVYCNLRTVVWRQRGCRSQAYLRGMKRRGANGIRTCSLAERRGNAAAQEPHDHSQAQVRLTSVVLTHGVAPDNAQRTVPPPLSSQVVKGGTGGRLVLFGFANPKIQREWSKVGPQPGPVCGYSLDEADRAELLYNRHSLTAPTPYILHLIVSAFRAPGDAALLHASVSLPGSLQTLVAGRGAAPERCAAPPLSPQAFGGMTPGAPPFPLSYC